MHTAHIKDRYLLLSIASILQFVCDCELLSSAVQRTNTRGTSGQVRVVELLAPSSTGPLKGATQ